MRMIAIEPCNNAKPGEEFEAGDREAEQLVSKRLARIKGPSANKMAPPAENKANPTGAAGEDAASSASPADQASPKPTARASRGGGRRAKTAE